MTVDLQGVEEAVQEASEQLRRERTYWVSPIAEVQISGFRAICVIIVVSRPRPGEGLDLREQSLAVEIAVGERVMACVESQRVIVGGGACQRSYCKAR